MTGKKEIPSNLEEIKKELCRQSFSNFFDNVNIAVYLMNKENKFIAVNKYAEKMYGYKAEEFIGRTPEFISAPDKNDLEKTAEYLRKAFDGEPQRFNFWGLRKNGEVFYKEVRMHKAKFMDEEVVIVTGEDLTEQLKLKEKVKISEERYKAILDNTNDAVMILLDKKMVFANRRLTELLEYELDELLFKPFDQYLLDEYKEQLNYYYEERLKGNKNLPKEYIIQVRTKTGKIKYLNVKPLVIPWGDDVAVLEIVNDITETYKARQHRETLHKIIENSSSVLFEWEEKNNGYVTFVTNNIEKLLGYKANDLLERKIGIFDIILENDLAEYKKKIAEYDKPGLFHVRQVYRIRKSDGEIIFVEDNTTVEIEKHTGNKKIFGIVSDITERYLLQRELEKKEQRYKAVLDSSPDAFVVTYNAVIVFANKSLSKLLQIPLEEIIGQPMKKFIYPEDFPIVQDRYMRRLRGDKSLPTSYDFRVIDKNGKILWVRLHPTVLEWEGKPATFAFIRDVTKEKLTHEQLVQSEFKYRTIIENISEAIIVQRDFKLKYYNSSFVKYIEAENETDLKNYDISKLVYYKDLEKVFDNYKNRMEGKPAKIEDEIRIITLKKNMLWVLVKSIIIDWEGEKSVLSFISDITERKKAEMRTRESERLLETLMDSTSDDIFCYKDGDGRWLKANKADLELFRLTGVDYVGKTDADLIPYSPFFKEAFLTCMETDEKCWQNGVSVRGDEVIETPDGEVKIFDVIKTPIFNSDGSRKGLIVFGRNVTAQRRAEEALRRSQKQYKTLFDNLHESIVVTQNGLVKFHNPAFVKLTGYTPEELNEKIIVELIHPSDRPKAIDSDENGFNMHVSEEPYEFRMIRRDGDVIWVANHALEITWENDEKAVMNFIRDVTNKKLAFEELNKLSTAVEQSEQGFIILDSYISIEYANPYIYKLFEMNEEELVGRTPDILTPKELSENSIPKIVSALLHDQTWRGELKLRKKSGKEFWGYLIITPVKNAEGELSNFLVIIIDIDEIKRVESELKEAKNLAEKSSELKSQFLALMSHEIRTPINATLSFASLLKEELEDKLDDDLKFAFKSMETAGKRIIRTIDLLLNMSEVQVGSYEFVAQELDLEKIISEVLLEYKQCAKNKGLEIYFHKNTDEVILPEHDEYSVKQIFLNIVDNAVKYTKEGQIDITLGRNMNDELFVEVKDTGIGISKKYLEELFTPFSQEDQGYTRKFEGNGLGLALVHEFAKLNNARIEVVSEKDKGSVFTVIFSNESEKNEK